MRLCFSFFLTKVDELYNLLSWVFLCFKSLGWLQSLLLLLFNIFYSVTVLESCEEKGAEVAVVLTHRPCFFISHISVLPRGFIYLVLLYWSYFKK